MKPNRLTCVILLILTCVLFLQTGCEDEYAEPRELSPEWFDRFPEPVEWTTASATPKPSLKVARIAFEKVVHDFGVIGPETQNFCEFKFKNTGDGILKIEEVTKDCGCTPFELDKTEFAPGESGTLKVNYVTDTQLGPATKELTIHSNDIKNPEVILAVKATITATIDYEPKMLSLMLKSENAGCPPLTITSIDDRPFSISYIQSTNNCITADFDPSVESTRFELQPKVNMDTLETILNGTVEIGLTHPECKKISVAVRTKPRFTMTPRSLTIRNATPNTVITKKIRIINNYGEAFSFDTPKSKNGSITVLNTTVIPDRGYELDLQITPPAIEDTRKTFSEELSLDLSSGLQLNIPCYVFYSGATETPQENSETCTVCGPRIIDPKTGKVTYANPEAKNN
ncbi:MAG: DUF1573 domain-containing protein [Sedimentisphaerales bacterium]|nr:DUF1573 domain-containing protein [Sedimentisphaerales bacterium]